MNFSFLFDTGSVVGDSYVVIPSACYDIEAATDDIDQLDLNTRRMFMAALLMCDCILNV